MTPRAADDGAGRRALALCVIAALVYLAARFAAAAGDPVGYLIASPFNDSIMRYLSVRDWLDGQNWFDMSNHRVLPPEGLSLHWSRYVDLGIGAVVAGLGLLVPPERATALSLVAWPALLFVAFLALTTRAALRHFGPGAAAVAVLTTVLWQLNWNYFGPAQLDHHGPQILCLAVVIFSLLGDGDSQTRRGLIGGAAAALSLAIGLENLLPIAAAGLILALRTVLRPETGAAQLRAFGLAFALLAGLLHLGQTPPAEWLLGRCDELGPAFLGLAGLAALAASTLAAGAPRLARLPLRIGLAAATALLAGAGAALILQTCPGFPYGNLPVDLQRLITSQIGEARPSITFLREASDPAFTLLPTAFGTTALASILLAVRHRRGTDTRAERRAVGVLLVFAWIGCLGSLLQFRMLLLSAPAVPLLLGYAMACLFRARRAMANPSAGSLAILATAVFCLAPGQAYVAYRIGTAMTADASAVAAEGGPRTVQACRTAEVLDSLAALPPGRVMSGLSLSVAILLATDHAIVSAPYHRSATALRNGTLALRGDAGVLLAAVDGAEADYLVLCRDAVYGAPGSFVSGLARGLAHPALLEHPGVHPDLVVLVPAP